jgi:hypothetical protein
MRPLPCEKRALAAARTLLKAILLQNFEISFATSMTPSEPAAGRRRLLAVEEDATNGRNGVTRFVG